VKAERAGLAVAPLAGGCIVGFAISWNIANTGAVAEVLSHRYGTSLAVIGLLTTVLFFAELAVMIPGGRAIDRYGAKRVGVIAVLLSLVPNLLLLLTTSVALALILRTVAGIGVGLGFLAGAIYAQGGRRGATAAMAGGIYGGISLGGGGVALAIVPSLDGALGWRAPYWSGVAVGALALLALAACPATPPRGTHTKTPPLRELVRHRDLARLGVIASVSFGFSVILGNWVVTLLERTGGYSRGAAGATGSLILILGIFGRPAGGVLVRLRPAATWRTVGASFLVGGTGTALLALSLGRVVDPVAAAMVGLSAGIPFGATVAGASRAYPGAEGAAVGAMNSYPVLAIVIGTPLLGLTFSLPSEGRIGFAVAAALWVATLAVLPRGRAARQPAGDALPAQDALPAADALPPTAP